MSSSNNATDIEIRNPQTWKLALRVDSDCVRLVAYSEVEQNSLVNKVVQLEGSEDNFLRSLENCIYDNPVFLLDFKQVNIEVTSQRFIVVPDDFSEGQAIDAFCALFGSIRGDIVTNALPHCHAQTVFEIPQGVLQFFNRTFSNCTVFHHLTLTCEHFAAKSINAGVNREFVYLHDGCADLFVFKGTDFSFTNSYTCHTPDDAIFFILNAWKLFGLNATSDELQIIGDRSVRDVIAPVLRNYITYVMPAIFPAASMRMGHDAMKSPFDLILLLLRS